MATIKQIEANRRNALRSTGPNTAEGKATVALNAMKHGLLSRELLLPGENGAAFAELAENLRAQLAPVGALESLLVDRVIAAVWRLHRLIRVETGLFAFRYYQALADRARMEVQRYSRTEGGINALLASLNDARTIVTDEAKHEAALQQVREAEALRDGVALSLGRAFAAENATLAMLSRYEMSIERGLFRALHELQRLQSARMSQPAPEPVSVDLNAERSISEEIPAAGDEVTGYEAHTNNNLSQEGENYGFR
jgi:hypothetical protein